MLAAVGARDCRSREGAATKPGTSEALTRRMGVDRA